MIVHDTVHVRFAGHGVVFCDMCLTPEQAADLSQKIIISLDMYYNSAQEKCPSK
jgi:hypothetical protein